MTQVERLLSFDINPYAVSTDGAVKSIDVLRAFTSWEVQAFNRIRNIDNRAKKTTGLLFMLNRFDPTTYRHSVDVGDLLPRFAEIAGLNLEGYGITATDLRLAGWNHDALKLGWREDIIRRNGPLSDMEREFTHMHPELGGRLMRYLNLSELDEIITEEHHEWWNGGGYPYGLKGNQIHPLGRIAAVADKYQAMKVERPYKPPWTIEAVTYEMHHMFDEGILDSSLRPVYDEFISSGIYSCIERPVPTPLALLREVGNRPQLDTLEFSHKLDLRQVDPAPLYTRGPRMYPAR